MAKNLQVILRKSKRKCPICMRPLKPNGAGKWFCNNPKCRVQYVRFDREGFYKKIVYAQGGF